MYGPYGFLHRKQQQNPTWFSRGSHMITLWLPYSKQIVNIYTPCKSFYVERIMYQTLRMLIISIATSSLLVWQLGLRNHSRLNHSVILRKASKNDKQLKSSRQKPC